MDKTAESNLPPHKNGISDNRKNFSPEFSSYHVEDLNGILSNTEKWVLLSIGKPWFVGCVNHHNVGSAL